MNKDIIVQTTIPMSVSRVRKIANSNAYLEDPGPAVVIIKVTKPITNPMAMLPLYGTGYIFMPYQE